MASHGYDCDFHIANSGGSWNQYESYAISKRHPTTCPYDSPDGRRGSAILLWDVQFLCFQDAIHDWCEITELEPEKCGLALGTRCAGEAAVYKRLRDRDLLRSATNGVSYVATSFHQRSSGSVSVQVHAVHEPEQMS